MSNWDAYKRLQETMLRKNAAGTQSAMSRFRAGEQEAMASSPTSSLYNETGMAMARNADALERNLPLSAPRPPVNNSRYRYTGIPPSRMNASVDGSRLLESISAGGGGDGGGGDGGGGDGGGGDGGGGDGTTAPPQPRERRPAKPMKKQLMGSAGGGGLDQLQRNRSTANQFQQLQRRSYAATPNPRQRFTA